MPAALIRCRTGSFERGDRRLVVRLLAHVAAGEPASDGAAGDQGHGAVEVDGHQGSRSPAVTGVW